MKRVIREKCGSVKPGQDLLAVGYIGQIGTKVIAGEKKSELLTRFSDAYIAKMQFDKESTGCGNPELWERFGVTECEAVEEGGILTALWNLSGAYEAGIEFTLRQIPIKQETVEVCECYDLNPYCLMSGGCFVLVADDGEGLISALAEENIPAAVIGKVKSGIKREVLNAGNVGYLGRPQKDELKKVVPSYFQNKDRK